MLNCTCRIYDKNRVLNFYLPDEANSLNMVDYLAEAATQLFDNWYDGKTRKHESTVMVNLPVFGPMTVLPHAIASCFCYATEYEWDEYTPSPCYDEWLIRTDGTIWWLSNYKRVATIAFVEVDF